MSLSAADSSVQHQLCKGSGGKAADKLPLCYLDKIYFYCFRRLLEQKRNSLSSNFQFSYLRKEEH